MIFHHPLLRLSFALIISISVAAGASAQSRAVMSEPASGPTPLEGCEDGVVKDDSMPESGYGWVSSVIEGIYVQEFENSDLVQPVVDEVCICFLRGGPDEEINFDVVFYRQNEDGIPEETPYASFPATLDGVPFGSGNGKFAVVPTPGVRLPLSGTFYVGARWDATQENSFFICDDQSDTTEFVNVWFRDDRALGWDNTATTIDSIFLAHRAMLIRIVGSETFTTDIPTLNGRSLALLVGALALAGVAFLRRTR